MSDRFPHGSHTPDRGASISPADIGVNRNRGGRRASRDHQSKDDNPTLSAETMAESARRADIWLFDCGTILKLRLRAVPDSGRSRAIVLRAASVALIGWVPLVLLTGFQSAVLNEAGAGSFFSDVAVNSRSLIAAPLLVLAELVALPRLGAIAFHFRSSGVVSRADAPRFESAWNSTLRLRDSKIADIAIIAIAYAAMIALISSVPASAYPGWHLSSGQGSGDYSVAGWWHALVSMPLLLILIFNWIWRLLLWTRFLVLMARCDLKLVPAHPDRTAGLRFVAYSVQAFSIVALAVGVISAGSTANRILYWNAPVESVHTVLIPAVAGVILVFAGPLFAFTAHLLRAWRRGTLQYSALAGRLGRQFEAKWLRGRDKIDAAALEAPDFSATTDLFQVASNVYEVRLVPVSVASLGIVVAMTVLPFLAVALMFVPLDVVAERIAQLLLGTQ